MSDDSKKANERVVVLLVDALTIADHIGDSLLAAKIADALECAVARQQR